MQVALPRLPSRHAASPLYYALFSGLHAIREKTREHKAVVEALKDRESADLSLGEEVWKNASQLAGVSSNTDAGRIAEIALKRTYASLLRRFSDEFADRSLPTILATIDARVTDEQFVEELITNYLFEVALIQMRKSDNDRLEFNGARTYHFAGGKLLSSEEEASFRQDLKDQCNALSKKAVRSISETRLITALRENKPFSAQLLKDLQDALNTAISPGQGVG